MRRPLSLPVFVVSEALHYGLTNRVMTLLSIATMGVSFFTFGLFALFEHNLAASVSEWRASLSINIFLDDSIEKKTRQELLASLREEPLVDSVLYVSKEEARKKFGDLFPALKENMMLLGENPLPASFELRLQSAEASPAAVVELARRVKDLSGVTDVQYDLPWYEKMEGIIRAIRAGGLGFGFVLFLAAAFTVSNVIRIAVYARSDEIAIMRLVGATGIQIKGPFILEGAVQGFLGALLGLVVLHGFQAAAGHWVAPRLPLLYSTFLARFPEGGESLWLLAAGLLVGALSSAFALRRLPTV